MAYSAILQNDLACRMTQRHRSIEALSAQGGRRPVVLPGAHNRSFLDDGDTVSLKAWCERAGVRVHRLWRLPGHLHTRKLTKTFAVHVTPGARIALD